MRPLLILPFLALPAAAQEVAPPSTLERGLELFLDGLIEEMAPALRDLESLAEQARPFLEDWAEGLGAIDLDLYHPPEILENGDIIIRRRRPDEILPNPDGSIDL